MSDEKALLDAIRAEPDERANYLVYGDWLAQQGDPRGELIGFSHALEANPGDLALARRVDKLLAALVAKLPRGVTASWRLGFVNRLQIDAGSPQLAVALRNPLVQLVETISVVDRKPFDAATRSPVHARALATIMLEAPTATVRRIEIGSPRSELLPSIEDLQKLLDRFPRLTELTLHASSFPAGLVEVLSPRIVELELASIRLTNKLMRDIAKASWPNLRKLALHLPVRDRPDQPTSLEPLVIGRGFPALRDLRLREHPQTGQLTDRFCGEIVRSRLLPQLEVLDFSVRGLDLDAIRPAYPKLRHLARLLPSAEDEVDTTDLEALQQIAWLLEEPDTPRAIARRSTTRSARGPIPRAGTGSITSTSASRSPRARMSQATGSRAFATRTPGSSRPAPSTPTCSTTTRVCARSRAMSRRASIRSRTASRSARPTRCGRAPSQTCGRLPTTQRFAR